jgi:hypothetical protein
MLLKLKRTIVGIHGWAVLKKNIPHVKACHVMQGKGTISHIGLSEAVFQTHQKDLLKIPFFNV